MTNPDWARDEIILACALVKQNGWRGLDQSRVEVGELSRLLRAAPFHPPERREEKFRNRNGVARKTADIATQHPDYQGRRTRGNRLDAIVLEDFLVNPARMDAVALAIREAIVGGTVAQIPDDEIYGDEIAEDEGRLLVARHLRRERSRKLRSAKLREAKRLGRSIACEVCGFDFGHRYGDLGSDFIEVHHRLPLHASGATTTRLRDLVMLCSNCHRMIHRASPWITPEELRRNLIPAPERPVDETPTAMLRSS